MTTNFPGGLDNFVNPAGTSLLTNPDHAGQHTDLNDAVEALEAKVGVNGSLVASTIDYKLANDVVLKSVVTAKGDLVAGTATGAVARVGVGADDQVLMARASESTGLAFGAPRLAGGAARPLLTGGAYLDGSTGLVLSGLLSNFASSPDSAALDVTGDIDIKVKVSLAAYNPPAAIQGFVNKWIPAPSAYMFFLSTNQTLQFHWVSGGVSRNFNSSAAIPTIAANSTKWFRATLDVDNGAGQAAAKFYTSDDGTTWTQLGTTQTGAFGTTSIDNTAAGLRIGARDGDQPVNGTIHRVIIQSAYDTANNTASLAYDANFETATADALAFTETANSATVTINTTRYTYGLPGYSYQSVGTDTLSINTDFFHFFYVTSPIVVDMVLQEVTAAPSSTSTAYFAIYAADNNFNPSGAPLVNETITIATSTTAVYSKQFTGVTLQPGAYISVFNGSVQYSMRTPLLNSQFIRQAVGSAPYLGQTSRSRTAATYPNPLPSFTTFSTSGATSRVYAIYRYRAA